MARAPHHPGPREAVAAGGDPGGSGAQRGGEGEELVGFAAVISHLYSKVLLVII